MKRFTANLAGRVEVNMLIAVLLIQGLLGILFTLLVMRMISHSHMMFHDSWLLKEWKNMGSFWEKGEEPLGKHTPSWLPTFPNPETYAARSSAGNEIMSASNGAKTKDSSCDGGDVGRAREAFDNNLYLAAPLHFREKEVSLVVLPANLSNEVALRNPVPENCVVGNHVSVLETFAPAIEVMKSGLCDLDNEEKKVFYN
ncbi:hypothetical protein CRYUN_Cryun22dG0037100 [Craigia yunnanensis]